MTKTPLTIIVPYFSANDETKKNLETIAEFINQENIKAVAEKCKKIGSAINGKLKTGLSFI